MSELRDEQILGSLLQHRLKLSARAIQAAKEAAWRDLPPNEQKTYLRYAELAVMADLNERKPS